MLLTRQTSRMWPHRIGLLVLLCGTWTSNATGQEYSGSYCLENIVHIQLADIIPPLVGVRAGRMDHLAFVENLTDRSVRLEIPIHYWGAYQVWGNRAMKIDQGSASPKERVDVVALGYVTVLPSTKRRLMAIEIGRPQDVFRYPPEPAEMDHTPEYDLIKSGVKCRFEIGSMTQPKLPRSTAPTTQEGRVRPYDSAGTAPQSIEPKDDGAPMVLIKGGEFDMGSNDGPEDEKPVHRVMVSAFYLDKHEVTNKLFRKFVEETRYQTLGGKGGAGVVGQDGKLTHVRGANWLSPQGTETVFVSNRDEHPVVSISWEDALAYCRRAGKRLPTEAEFEYAMRAGSQTMWWWGNGNPGTRLIGNIADLAYRKTFPDQSTPIMENYDDGNARTAQVRTYEVNSFGLYDMTGNVSEWTADWYDPDYYQKSPKKNPKGPGGTEKVVRGGSWLTSPGYLRSSQRFHRWPGSTDEALGFRCAKDAN